MGVLQALMAERGTETAVRLLAVIPGQTARSGVESVEAVLALGACEVDIQPFLLDPDTPLAHARLRHDDGWRQQPVHRLPTTVERAAIAAAMGACLAREGFTEYLPGVWALAGYESRYRRLRSTGCAVLGCGLGARTRVHGVVSVNTRDLATYLEAANDPERRVVERYAVPE